MKITVIGSHLCPDTLYALNRLTEAGVEASFQDILSCHAALPRRGFPAERSLRCTN